MSDPIKPPARNPDLEFVMEWVIEEIQRSSEQFHARLDATDDDAFTLEQLQVINHMIRPYDDDGSLVLSPVHRAIAERIAVEQGVDPDVVVAELTQRMFVAKDRAIAKLIQKGEGH